MISELENGDLNIIGLEGIFGVKSVAFVVSLMD
jgi:hypothetical protein